MLLIYHIYNIIIKYMSANKYYGGKYRYANRIADIIEQIATEDVYIEPFCGWCSVMSRVTERNIFNQYIASDANESIVMFFHETSRGIFTPPVTMTEEKYNVLKTQQFPSALQAFVGICYSFNGKWFRGYTPRYKNIRFNVNNSANLTRRIKQLKDVEFEHAMYQEYADREKCFFYMDPPYKSRTEGYKLHTGKKSSFDTDEFWEFARKLSEKNTVIVSEYEAPDDFECILEFPGRCGVEKVFKLKDVK